MQLEVKSGVGLEAERSSRIVSSVVRRPRDAMKMTMQAKRSVSGNEAREAAAHQGCWMPTLRLKIRG
jgi:hypothetical protein